MANQFGFIVHLERCVGCNACVVSCKSYNKVEATINRRTVTPLDENLTGVTSRTYRSIACNHCEDPACAKSCPTGAYTKDENGIVVHDFDVCIGCKMCSYACPYNAPCFNPEESRMDKCDMCKSLIDDGEMPMCVQSCPLEAIECVNMATIDESQYEKTVDGFPDITITSPNVRFVMPTAGTVVRRDS